MVWESCELDLLWLEAVKQNFLSSARGVNFSWATFS